jgi:two-component system response regulator YesN
MTVLLVDDEKTVRDGLKVIIDWPAYGFDTFLEGEDGSDCLSKMIGFNPELTLLDIRMPKMSGLEAAERARKAGYDGKIIMLSGYSDFHYAQSAIRCGVDAYLLKSIDENELAAAVQKVREDIQQKAEASLLESKNLKLARNSLLCDILLGRGHNEAQLFQHVYLNGDYRVVLIDFDKDAGESVRRLAEDTLKCCFAKYLLETVTIDGRYTMVLKNAKAVSQLSEAVKTARKRAGTPLFAGVGRAVNSFDEISLSYADARQMVEEKFFYNGSDIICFGGDSFVKGSSPALDPQNYLGKIQTYVEAGELEKIKAFLGDLKQNIMTERIEPEKAKGILSGLYIGLLGKLQSSCPKLELPIESEVVDKIFEIDYLGDIIGFLEDEFCRISSGIANTDGDIIKRILAYVEMNSHIDLKLESLANLFGYNSTYLGKIFKKAKGESFNTYVDRLRIRRAEALLSESGLKVYEICEKVGYKNLNYFYKKFMRYTGKSPTAYRNDMQTK